jgi:hypothetical protein
MANGWIRNEWPNEWPIGGLDEWPTKWMNEQSEWPMDEWEMFD